LGCESKCRNAYDDGVVDDVNGVVILIMMIVMMMVVVVVVMMMMIIDDDDDDDDDDDAHDDNDGVDRTCVFAYVDEFLFVPCDDIAS